MMNRMVTRSERNLLHINYVLVSKLKYVKKVFRKGKMIKAFENIQSLYFKNDFKEIERVYELLIAKMPSFHDHRYYKHIELMEYCQVLLDSRGLTGWRLQERVNETIMCFDTNHELGRRIQVHILQILVES